MRPHITDDEDEGCVMGESYPSSHGPRPTVRGDTSHMTTFLSWYHLIASQVGVLLLGLLLGRWFWILAEGYRRKPIACLVEGDETIETDDEDEGGEDSPPPAFGFAEGRERGGMSSEREDGTSNPGDTTP